MILTDPIDEDAFDEVAAGIDAGADDILKVAATVRQHHERWDGFGYPDRLRGATIPFGARIIGLVDAFDAMLHDRPYRPALEVESALLEILGEAGRQFDSDLVAFLIEVADPVVQARLRVRRA